MSGWYASWFDSPYYHLLYKHRDEHEASALLDRLMEEMEIPPNARMLDLACGRGRHARYLAGKGWDVTGIDLAASSISFAAKYRQENLRFFVHDMRLTFRVNYFDVVLNMFTSFGYFEDRRDNLRAMQAAADNLRPGGILVIDFFNSEAVEAQLPCTEEVEENGVHFHTEKRRVGDFFVKSIRVRDREKEYSFEEKVRALTPDDFKGMMDRSGLQLEQCFGDYTLQPFNKQVSERLIMLARKGVGSW